ncbi:MAG TPA: glycosyltransferase family 39 protein [Luteimonas sp.]|nr:glycosyltransferase family 39 protein [Luteimonas sp.]
MAAMASLVHEGRRLGLFPAAALVALVFFAKFAAYAWMVTPLWDVPDESGHYSYAMDVSRGEWPLLGEARIDDEVAHSWIGAQAAAPGNWIAQHPPLFYVLDAPAVLAARAMGLEFESRVRLARMPSALFGGLTILGLVLFLASATGRHELGLAGGIFLGSTPMFAHLSSGVTHDTLVACTATWAAYWIMRWLESERFAHVVYAGLLIAACTITKITGLAMAVPVFLAISWRLWRTQPRTGVSSKLALLRWARCAAALWLVMFLPVCFWIARNVSHFHEMFPDASHLHPATLVPIGFIEFMTRFPVWEHIVLNFIALVGWNGSGYGVLKWIQANGDLARYFLSFLAIGSLSAVFAPALPPRAQLARRVVIAVIVSAVACVYARWPEIQLARWTCLLVLAALVASLAAHSRAFWRSDDVGWLLATGAGCILFFLLAYYETLRGGFAGSMRATHGRYLYPVLPFLLLILLWPLRDRLASRLILCMSVFGMIVADGFFLRQVVPLYGQLPG